MIATDFCLPLLRLYCVSLNLDVFISLHVFIFVLLFILYVPVLSFTRLTCDYCIHSNKQEIRSVEHGICPIAEFTSPY